MTYTKNFISEIRLTREPVKKTLLKVLKSSGDAFDTFSFLFHGNVDIYESFYVLFLDRSNAVTAFSKMSQGGTTGTVVDVKIICKIATNLLAQGVICLHNHPSGNLVPSSQDISITKKLKNALDLFDIKLLDHLIVSADGYYSFADENNL